jgi:hypothetical protein
MKLEFCAACESTDELRQLALSAREGAETITLCGGCIDELAGAHRPPSAPPSRPFWPQRAQRPSHRAGPREGKDPVQGILACAARFIAKGGRPVKLSQGGWGKRDPWKCEMKYPGDWKTRSVALRTTDEATARERYAAIVAECDKPANAAIHAEARLAASIVQNRGSMQALRKAFPGVEFEITAEGILWPDDGLPTPKSTPPSPARNSG